MATFTNYATLYYDGGSTLSNTVTGELLDTLAMNKAAVSTDYSARDDVAYVVTLLNSGTTAISDLSLNDNLGVYQLNSVPYYPLNYKSGSIRYYVNGVLQPAPTVTGGPPLVISGLNVPAGGNAMLVYEATVTSYAPLGSGDTITNTASLTGGGLTAPVTDSATISTEDRAELSISKAMCPPVVSENGQLTYTFVIENSGNAPADADSALSLSDTFNPILQGLSVAFNGTAWTEGTNYSYDTASGLFTTLQGQLIVPAASYTQNPNGTWLVTPGTSTLTVTGTV